MSCCLETPENKIQNYQAISNEAHFTKLSQDMIAYLRHANILSRQISKVGQNCVDEDMGIE